MIFLLSQYFYGIPNLYDNLLEHYVATPAVGAPSGTFALGKTHDFSLTYEHSALATAKTNQDYRYVNLPDDVNLGDSSKNKDYSKAVIVMPDLFGTDFVSVPASRVIWGITVLKTAPDADNAIKFLQFMLTPDPNNNNQTPLNTALNTYGPAPITPPVVRPQDFGHLPKELRPFVQMEVDH